MAAKKTRKPTKKAGKSLKKPARPAARATSKVRPAAKPKAAARAVGKRAVAPAKPAKKKPAPAPKDKNVPAPKASAKKAAAAASAPKAKQPPVPEAKPSSSVKGGKSPKGARPSSSAPPAAKSKGAAPPAARSTRDGLRDGRAPLREPPPRLVSLPLPTLAPIKRASVEERAAAIEKRLAAQGEDFRKRYIESLDMSWIYHDSALEGVVYTFEELRNALTGQVAPSLDSTLQPTYDDIKRHKEAIEFVRDFGEKKRLPVTLDVLRKIYLILHPEEGDLKTVKYRKDIPQHRLYFHEYAPPDKVGYKVRQIVDWLNDPETKKTRNGVRIAARAHYDLLRVYPFATDSGKVARLFMNLLLMRSGLPPSIIHSTERQRYYEALKGSAATVLQMVQEAVENALSSVEKLLDEHESRKRGFVS